MLREDQVKKKWTRPRREDDPFTDAIEFGWSKAGGPRHDELIVGHGRKNPNATNKSTSTKNRRRGRKGRNHRR